MSSDILRITIQIFRTLECITHVRWITFVYRQITMLMFQETTLVPILSTMVRMVKHALDLMLTKMARTIEGKRELKKELLHLLECGWWKGTNLFCRIFLFRFPSLSLFVSYLALCFHFYLSSLQYLCSSSNNSLIALGVCVFCPEWIVSDPVFSLLSLIKSCHSVSSMQFDTENNSFWHSCLRKFSIFTFISHIFLSV